MKIHPKGGYIWIQMNSGNSFWISLYISNYSKQWILNIYIYVGLAIFWTKSDTFFDSNEIY